MMQYYDYLFKFTDEAEARAALPEWWRDEQPSDNGTIPAGWYHARQGSGCMEAQFVAQEATYDDEGIQITPQVLVPSYWVAIALPAQDDALWAIPNCVQVTERPEGTPKPLSQCIIKTRLTEDNYKAFIHPVASWAGAQYVWRE